MRVEHVVHSLDTSTGGPARSLPQFVSALNRQEGEHWLNVHADMRLGTAGQAPADILHDNGVWRASNHGVASACRKHAVHRIVSTHGMLQPWAVRQGRLKKRLAWVLYQGRDIQSARVVHVTSEAEAEGLRQLNVRVPLAQIPNGVAIPDTLQEPNRDGVRTALFLSRFNPVKGLPLLIEAWARIRPAGWRLVLAGPDQNGHRAQIERLVAAAGLQNAVSFPGAISDDDKWALYRSADLLVLPTHSENFGLVVAEALGAGLPVLTTRGAPWAELVAERCGWWTDVSADAIAAALVEATKTSRNDLDAMGARGRALVSRRYGWDGVAENMTAVYRWVLGRGERPPFVHVS